MAESKNTALTSCQETNTRAKLGLPHCRAAAEAAVRCRLSSGPYDCAAGLQTETAFHKDGLIYRSAGTLLTEQNQYRYYPHHLEK